MVAVAVAPAIGEQVVLAQLAGFDPRRQLRVIGAERARDPARVEIGAADARLDVGAAGDGVEAPARVGRAAHQLDRGDVERRY